MLFSAHGQRQRGRPATARYGSAFRRQWLYWTDFRRRIAAARTFLYPLTRRAFDYTRFDFLFDYLRTMRPQFLRQRRRLIPATEADA